MKVLLKRGPKGDREFGPESRARAWQRAESLGWLHAVEPKYEGDDLIVVDASAYYTPETWIMEYWDWPSYEWYRYGEGSFPSKKEAEEAIGKLKAIDSYSRQLTLRARRV